MLMIFSKINTRLIASRLLPGLFFLFFSSAAIAQCNGYPQLCNKRYDQVAYLTTHNAFNSDQDNFNFPNQNFNITTQLNAGVRGLMIDVYKDFLGNVVVYHGTALLGSLPFVDVLKDIETFLANNPNEIVTIILECNISANEVESSLNSAGLSSYLFAYNASNGWPTLQSMINNGEQLVIFSDKNDAGSGQTWYHYVWDHAVETEFSVSDTSDFNCTYNRGDSLNDLFILNHFITDANLGIGVDSEAKIINSNPFFINRALQCQQEKSKFPNFPTIDFYDLGDGFDVVNQLNGVGVSSEPPKLARSVSVYPNPTHHSTIFEGANFRPEVYSISGEKVSASIKKLGKSRYSIDLSELESGIYFIGSGSDRHKILKL